MQKASENNNSSTQKEVVKAVNKNLTEREVVLGVLVRCCKKCTTTVEKAEDEVEGVKSVSVSIRENTDKDLVRVKGTKELDVQKLMEYLKTKLNRKHVHVISDK